MPNQPNTTSQSLLHRSELLLGTPMMERMSAVRVIIFGVGGVGSWCAESLVRTGITHITLVDSDRVAATNCNRQLMATTLTIGQLKVEALRERLLQIQPQACIQTIAQQYSEENKDDFHLQDYTFVIDAIDSLKDKVSLILHATSLPGVTLFSSMGAALRVDPTQVRVSEFWEVHNDPLASVIRKRMRRNKTFPGRKFLCVHSIETPMENQAPDLVDPNEPNPFDKKQINGSLSHITGIFGMTLAGLVIKQLVNEK